jgi:hypothetical protein
MCVLQQERDVIVEERLAFAYTVWVRDAVKRVQCVWFEIEQDI